MRLWVRKNKQNTVLESTLLNFICYSISGPRALFLLLCQSYSRTPSPPSPPIKSSHTVPGVLVGWEWHIGFRSWVYTYHNPTSSLPSPIPLQKEEDSQSRIRRVIPKEDHRSCVRRSFVTIGNQSRT